MKLFRFGPAGEEKPGVVDDKGQHRDVSAFGEDFDEKFFGSDGVNRLKGWCSERLESCPVLEDGFRFGPATARPSKIICIGLNYREHAVETGAAIPEEPVIFFKATSAWTGPNDDVVLPRGSEKSDWEVELAIVIGEKARYVSKEDAKKHIAGYALHNDLSERGHQLDRGGQWVKGKSQDYFAPFGPYVVTEDAIDVSDLNLWLTVNGERVQDSSTSDMIFDVPTVVSYLSEFMTLLPGDVISTGTPQGVGLGFDPPRFLKAGDVCELGIDGLGTSKQKMVKED